MEDRYLFRAKRIDNGEWIEGFLYCSTRNHPYISGKYADLVEVDTSTICQCTGLKDKNGELIFENDIVYMRCNGLSGYGTVVYENGCYWVHDTKRNRDYPFSNHDVKYRVDGNAFDNPELLEVQE